MLEKLTPDTVMPPFNNAYSHGVVIPPGARVLHIAGQIGARPDGSVPEDGDEQAENVWRNIIAVVRAASMSAADIVKLTAYIVDENVYPAYAAARNRDFDTIAPPASTAIIVPRLLRPEWKIEVEAIAAQTT